jgi:hypothetical protein
MVLETWFIQDIHEQEKEEALPLKQRNNTREV